MRVKELFVKKGWGRSVLDAVLEALFPRKCVFCDAAAVGQGGSLCDCCREDIAFIEPPFCHRCGYPAEMDYPYPTEDFECGPCRKAPFAFDQARSLGSYDAILKKLIQYFKYEKQMGAVREMAPLIAAYFSKQDAAFWQGFCVSPLPLHFKKMQERRFDQSFLIARETARTLGLPLANGLLRRERETESQASKTKAERLRNVRGAFTADRPERVEGRDILLVDDVMTTGATADEAARVLKRNGASRVHVFTLARA